MLMWSLNHFESVSSLLYTMLFYILCVRDILQSMASRNNIYSQLVLSAIWIVDIDSLNTVLNISSLNYWYQQATHICVPLSPSSIIWYPWKLGSKQAHHVIHWSSICALQCKMVCGWQAEGYRNGDQCYAILCAHVARESEMFVCLSVPLPVHLSNVWIVTKRKKLMHTFLYPYTRRKSNASSFLTGRMIGGGRPLLPEILAKSDPLQKRQFPIYIHS